MRPLTAVVTVLTTVNLAAAAVLTINATTPLHTVAAPFSCFNIDTGSLFNGFDFGNAKLINLVRALSPTVVRVGGTAADAALYLPDDTRRGFGSTTVVSNKVWDAILAFGGATEAQIMWDLNGKSFRDASNKWEPTRNATAFLEYTRANHPGVDVLWSVGNEPSSTVPAAALADEAVVLQALLRDNYTGIGSAVFGPSFSTTGDSRSAAFMSGTKGITGFTTHRYPLGKNCDVASHLDPHYSAALRSALAPLVAMRAQHANPDLLLVLEETAGAYDGGCEGVTDRFDAAAGGRKRRRTDTGRTAFGHTDAGDSHAPHVHAGSRRASCTSTRCAPRARSALTACTARTSRAGPSRVRRW